MSRVGRAGFDQMKQSPMYQAWSQVAPHREAFPALMDKTGELLRQPYDWSDSSPEPGAQGSLARASAGRAESASGQNDSDEEFPR
jgi:hypothetical protein